MMTPLVRKVHKKAIANFVNEMYIILIGLGVGNILLFDNKQFDFTQLKGYVDALMTLFVVFVAVRSWLDWTSYIEGEIKTSNREFILDFLMLINIELLFVQFDNHILLAALMLTLAFFDFLWVINYKIENSSTLKAKTVNERSWIIEKLINIFLWVGAFILVVYISKAYWLDAVLIVVAYTAYRTIGFRSVSSVSDEMKFREVTPADINEIVRIHNLNVLNRDGDKHKPKGFLLSEITPEIVNSRIKEEYSRYYIVESSASENSQILGYLELTSGDKSHLQEQLKNIRLDTKFDMEPLFTDRHVHILTVARDPAYAQKGVGRFTYEKIKEEYAAKYLSAFIVRAPYNNKKSLEFHVRNGFREVGTFEAQTHAGLNNYKSDFMVRMPES